ncbi:MAG: hypothetical protein P4L84_34790 [Isosphaeraceae bacterium]|nr:hypothetical protein [Isosphaeraceae bacterium]
MNEPGPDVTVALEGLVRKHLERQAETVDPRPVFARIQASLATEGLATISRPVTARLPARPGRLRAKVLWQWGGYAAAAALLLVTVTLVPRNRVALASANALVREAQQAHRVPVDRCYLVEIRRDSSQSAEWLPPTSQVRLTRLWTRGDRFWVESVRPVQRWAWGRDEENRFWIAFGPQTAVRLEADEVPFGLKIHCDLHSLNFEKWLGDVLNRFELTRETRPADASTHVVRAKARALDPRGPAVQSAELEIDAETRVVRRMVVQRVLNGRPFATVTYTLTETDTLDPADYRLEGHVSDRAEVYTRDYKPERRKELLARWFGPRPGHPFRAPELVK